MVTLRDEKLPDTALDNTQTARKEELLYLLNMFSSESDSKSGSMQLWEKYLKSRYAIDNRQLIQTIENLFNQALHEETELNNTIKDVRGNKSTRSTQWLKDLENKFGKAYLQENIANVSRALLAVQFVRDDELQEVPLKKAIYAEIRYASAVDEYLQDFIDFYAALKLPDKEKFVDLEHEASNFLSNKRSRFLTKIISIGGLQRMAIIRTAKDEDPDLFIFFYNHEDLKPSFSALKIYKSIRSYLNR